jgi:hypothetical protein
MRHETTVLVRLNGTLGQNLPARRTIRKHASIDAAAQRTCYRNDSAKFGRKRL